MSTIKANQIGETIPVSKGGTGQTTQTGSFDSLSPLTTKGDLLTRDTSNNIRVPVGTNGTFLKADSSVSPGITWTSTISTSATRSVTTTDTATTSDDVLILSGASFTETLPTAVGNTGKILILIHNGTSLTQVYTIDGNASETIGGYSTYPLYTNGEAVKIISDGANWLILDHKTETDWVDVGAVTIDAVNTAPSKGTILTDSMRWKRKGSAAVIRYNFVQSTAGSGAGSGDYIISLPANIVIDTTVIPAIGAGANPAQQTNTLQASMLRGYGRYGRTATANGHCVAFCKSSTTFSLMIATYYTALDWWASGFAALNTANIGISIEFEIPVVGWKP